MMVKILGSGQDGGIPHVGCTCKVCSIARSDLEFRRLGPSIALIEEGGECCFLIDASPEIKYQLDLMMTMDYTGFGSRFPVTGILLTHAHFGHITGLLSLGPEAYNSEEVPVYCTQKMADFLENSGSYALLVKNKNIILREMIPGELMDLESFSFTPFPSPHRSELSDCAGFVIESKDTEKKLVYLPDIDGWTDEVLEHIRGADIAIIDGTFYSQDEISRFREVPHPPIRDTIEILGKGDGRIYFTHINHTNPVNREGKEKMYVMERGFGIAYDGMELSF
jgi:pyrroloquinoline quinone biosynthesis protein B